MPAQIAMKTHVRRCACRGHSRLPLRYPPSHACEDRQRAATMAWTVGTSPAVTAFDITTARSAKTMWRYAIAGVCAVFVLAGDAKAYKAYVSNEKSNTISVIDTGERKVVGTIKVGQRP